MENLKIEKLLREKTMNLFSKEWYEKTTSEVSSLFKVDVDAEGYVYFFKCEKSSYVKIGKSYDINLRAKTLRNNLGNLQILGFIYQKKYNEIETELHRFFKDKRMHGEWFNLSINEIHLAINDFNGTKLNNLFSDVEIIDGNCDFKITDENLDNSIFYNFCDFNITINYRHYSSDLRILFKEFNLTPNKLTMMLKKWAVKNNFTCGQKSTNGKKYLEFS